jgi:uncharacterized membrane protein
MDALFPFHPRLVHFPIALSLVGVAFVALGFFRAQDRWVWYGRLSILLGWIGAVGAALAGLIDQSRAANTQAIADTINLHITVGIALIVVFGLSLYWPLRDKKLLAPGGRRWAYLAFLLLGAALILLESWLGGQLVYKLGVGVR